MQDVKIKDQIAENEITGHEIARVFVILDHSVRNLPSV